MWFGISCFPGATRFYQIDDTKFWCKHLFCIYEFHMVEAKSSRFILELQKVYMNVVPCRGKSCI